MGADTGPVVVTNGGRYPMEVRVKIDFVRRKGSEATGNRQAWREEISSGIGKQQKYGRIRGRGIVDMQCSDKWRASWRDNGGAVCWDREGGLPDRRIILCEVEKSGVSGKVRRLTLPCREV